MAEHDLTQRRFEELAILNEMSRALASALDFDMILCYVYQYTARLMDATNFFVALYDPKEGLISFPVVYDDDKPFELPPNRVGAGGLTDYIIHTGEPLLLSGNVMERIKELDIPVITYGDDAPPLSWLGVPILYGNQVLGAIVVQSITTAGLFQEHELEILTGISRQAANAIAISHQFSQTQKALAEARRNQERFELAVQGSNDGLWDWDIVTNEVYFSPRWKAMIGYEPEEISDNYVELETRLHPEDHDLVMQTLKDYLEGRLLVYEVEFRFRHKDGSYRWILARGSATRDEHGAPLRMAGSHTDITERRMAEEHIEALVKERTAALRLSEERYQTIFESTPVMFWLKDTQNRTLRINRAAAAFEGVKPEDVEGKSAFELYPYEQAQAFYEDDQQVIRSGQPKLGIVEKHTSIATGELMWVETGKVPVRDSSGEVTGVLAMGIDITERKRLEQQAQDAFELRGYQVKVSTQIAQEISTAPALDELLERVVSLVKEQFEYYHVQILRYEPALDAVVLVSGYGEVGQKMLAAGHQMKMGAGLIGVAAATGETVLRPDLSGDPDWKPNPLLPETKGEIAVPIKLRAQVLGVLDVQSDRAGALSHDDRLLLEGLCGQIAGAIEGTRLRQEMEERLNELNVLYRATSREGWQSIREAGRLPEAYVYDRLVIQPVENLWLPEIQHAVQKQALEPPHKQDNGFAGQPAAVAPLAVRGEIIGALGVYEDAQDPLSEDDMRLVEQVSEQVSQALESVRLFEQSQQALSETHALYASSARIIGSSSLQEVLLALAETTALQRLDHAAALMFDQPWEAQPPASMSVVAVWDKSQAEAPEAVGTVYEFNQYPLSGLFYRDEPFIAKDISIDERIPEQTRKLMTQAGICSGVIFPLKVGDQWFGSLIGQAYRPTELTNSEIRQLTNVIGQAATVIQSMRLQEGMRERVRELTALQRTMSREAWATYQTMAMETRGYYFDQVSFHPMSESLSTAPEEAGDSAGAGPIAATQLAKQVFTTALTVRGEPIGVLGVRQEPSQLLTPEEEDFLKAVSEQVAQALERARLIDQAQKSAVELQAVAEVSTASSTILEPEQLLQEVVDLTKRNFGLYHAHIYLLNDTSDSLVLAVGAGAVGKSMASVGWSIPYDEEDSVVARTARERRGFVVPDVRKEPGFMPNPLLPDTLSELAVPMIVGDKILGVFDVQSDRIKGFSEEDTRTFFTLAAQVSVALQNARLYVEQLATVERLRELDNMKSAFLANMSHELRTPLNSILGFTQVIVEGIDGPLTDVMTTDLELIEKNGQHLLRLINDVLDMAKIEAGRLSLSTEPLNMYEMLEDVLLTNGPLARDRNLYLELNADPTIDWTVVADSIRLRQILINLIGNSIKFTEVGGIAIDIAKLPASAEFNKERLQVIVRDTGIGIPPDKLETIFEAFSQVDSSTTRKASGTGLGLPISRRLVELHGGRLWAESKGVPGEGSTFYLELPVLNPVN